MATTDGPPDGGSRTERRERLGEQIDRIMAADRQIAMLHAHRAVLIEEARQLSLLDAAASAAEARATGRTDGGGWDSSTVARRELTSELGCALRIPERSAERLLEESRALMHDLPATRRALELGEISYRHGQRLVDHAASLPEAALPAFESAVLPHARVLTVSKFDRKARIERERRHPETIGARVVAARTQRDLMFEPARDGMAWLSAYLPAEVAAAAYNRVTDIAESLRGPDEQRTMAQLRTDIVVDLLIDGVTDSIDDEELGAELAGLSFDDLEVLRSMQFAVFDETGTAMTLEAIARATGSIGVEGAIDVEGTDASAGGSADGPTEPARTVGSRGGVGSGIRATVHVTVPVLSLLGLSEEPATLDGFGPIDIETARGLAAGAPSFTRLLTHPETGAVLSVGRDSYPVPRDLRRWLRVRDGTCRFPGCSKRAGRCEIDHTQDWAYDGLTEHDNLAHLCPDHHHLKHHTLWRVRHRRAGTLEWTSPTGRTHLTEPEMRMGTVAFQDLAVGAGTGNGPPA